MRPSIRSASGAVLMLAIIPIFAGLLACMPVPIGDPEKSRIDPDISGVWFVEVDGSFDAIYNYQPYDKRTWLMIGAPIEEGPDYAGESLDIESAEDAAKVLGSVDVGDDGITASGTVIYKVWLTKLGGQTFMTWEITGAFDSDGHLAPEYWYTFRVEKPEKDRIDLYMVNGEHDAFNDLKEPVEGLRGHEYPGNIRRDWERALRKAAKKADDTELFAEDPITLHRVPEDLLDAAAELFTEVIEWE